MTHYERSKKLIAELLEIALKENEFVDFVAMTPNYSIESRNLNGIVEPNRYFTMEAIYDYYRTKPMSNIDKKLYDALVYIAKEYKGEHMVNCVLDTVLYQLNSEKNNSAPFKMDCQSILNELRNMLIQNKNMYMQPKEELDNVPFWNSIEKYNEDLCNEYGHKVL